MTLLRALAFHPRMPLPEPERRGSLCARGPNGGNDAAAGAAAVGARAADIASAAAGVYQSGAGGAQSATARAGSNQTKRVNRQPHPARGR